MPSSWLMQWSDHFLTDIKEIDDQHFFLVDLVNRLGRHLFQKDITLSVLKEIVEQLHDYTRFHFSSEEVLMVKKKVYGPFIKDHQNNHTFFVREVVTLYEELKDGGDLFNRGKFLLDFLIHWLAFHILEQDQLMAEQIKLIDKGIDAKEAYEKASNEFHGQVAPLVQALSGLFSILSSRNHELIGLKKELEQKVQERTEELILANKKLERLAVTDPLTNIYNRRYAMACMESLWKKRGTDVFCCMVLDIDSFKEVNDTYGHDMGDQILIQIARAITFAVRTDDIVCRLGGDEFLVLCPGTPLEGGIRVAGNALKSIANMKVGLKDGRLYKGSASIGVASSEGKVEYTDLLKEADQRAYAAKKAGRNCIRPLL